MTPADATQQRRGDTQGTDDLLAQHGFAYKYSPDEHPFTPIDKLPQPIIAPQSYPSILHAAAYNHPSTNVNSRILEFYVQKIAPAITRPGWKGRLEDDGNYGSAATRDVEVLQALSRRIHYGASSAFPQSPC